MKVFDPFELIRFRSLLQILVFPGIQGNSMLVRIILCRRIKEIVLLLVIDFHDRFQDFCLLLLVLFFSPLELGLWHLLMPLPKFDLLEMEEKINQFLLSFWINCFQKGLVLPLKEYLFGHISLLQ